MSDEKKTSWGKGYDVSATTQEPKQAPPAGAATGDAPVREAAAPADDGPIDDGPIDDARPRARNQHVLPGILGRQLRAAYGELLNAPVPDRINELIRQLESSECDQAAGDKPSDEERST